MLQPDDPVYFTVREGFLRQDVIGRFGDSVIFLMGCDGMKALGTAQTLLEMGASAVIGWSGEVAVDHTDRATEFLLRQYLIEGQPLTEAIRQTIAGTAGEEELVVRQVVIVHKGVMLVVRTTLKAWAAGDAGESAEKFMKSVRLL